MSEALPPIIPSSDARNVFQSLARASWIAPLIGLAANFFLVVSGKQTVAASVFISVVFLGGGLLLGVTSLFGMVKHGRKRILLPALVGMSIPLALSVLALPNVYHARQRALRHELPEAPVHSTTARLLKDEALRFSMDIPDGFVEWNAGGLAQNIAHCYSRALPGTASRLVVSVQRLNGVIPFNEPLRREDVVNHALPGTKLDLTKKNWRGLSVDTFIAKTVQSEVGMISYGAQIPLVPRAIQINVAGPASQESEIAKLVDEILMSLEGTSNWETVR